MHLSPLPFVRHASYLMDPETLPKRHVFFNSWPYSCHFLKVLVE